MAQLLYLRHSTNTHLNAAKRHMRLCRQIKGGDKFAARIEPFFKDLASKKILTEEARLNREIMYDDIVLRDADLDNSIRTLFEKTKQFDREYPGRPVLNQIFPEGKMASIIYAPFEDETILADQMLAKLASLGTDHQLAGMAEPIKSCVEKCREAIKLYHTAINIQKSAEADEEISKSNLSRQYEYNYLDIAREFGKRNGDRFFPRISNPARNGNDDADNDTNPGAETLDSK